VAHQKDQIWRVVVADQRSPRDGRVDRDDRTTTTRQTETSTIVIDGERAAAGMAAARSRRTLFRKLLRNRA